MIKFCKKYMNMTSIIGDTAILLGKRTEQYYDPVEILCRAC